MKTMVDPIDDIARQARQGGVVAISQVLNEKLADVGVRTRAILAEGVLKVLCEAPKAEQLDQSNLVDRVRQILERTSPRHVHRVNINSRIVREQQLLWLDEIRRNPDDLLWSEEITLARGNPIQRFFEDRKMEQAYKISKPTPSLHTTRAQQQFRRGLVGGISVSALLLLLGWVAYRLRDPQAAQTGVNSASIAAPASAPAAASPAVPAASPVASPAASPDPFAQAVRLAEQSARDGKAATTSADWLTLATRWQQASDLMSRVPAQDRRHSTAQDRIQVYRQNSEAALQKAQELR